MPNKRSTPVRDRIRGQLLSDAGIGMIAWIALFYVPLAPHSGHALIERMFLFAPLVIVPLGVRLSTWPDERGQHPLLFVAASYLHPLAAVMAVGSVLLEPGLPAGIAAGAWCAYCVLLAAWGVVRHARDHERALAELSIDVALVYIALGGACFVLARVGARPPGFSDEQVALTAVHFHYAGFAAPIVAGLAGRVLARSAIPHVLWRIGVRAVMAGPIAIVIAITISPLVEVIVAFTLATALTMLAAIVALRATPRVGAFTRGLLWASACSLFLTMALACAYALGQSIGADWLDVETMARVHGLASVFGFALPGMLAFTVEEPRLAR